MLLAVAAAGWLIISFVFLQGYSGWGVDFGAYLSAAARLAHGQSPYYASSLQGPFRPGPVFLYLYAPPLAVALLPFTGLPVAVATNAWYVLRASLLVLAIASLPVRPTVRLAVLVLAAANVAVAADLVLGNVSVLVFVAAAACWRFLDRWPSGASIALALTVRPQLGVVLIWWFIRRRWRPLLAAGVTLVAAIAITLPVVGANAYVDFATVLRNVSGLTGAPSNTDIGSTLLRRGFAPWFAEAALFLGHAVAIGAMLLSFRKDREVGYVVTVSATLLLSPLLWEHYLVLALLPAALLMERGHLLGTLLGLAMLPWLPVTAVPLVALVATLGPLLAPGPRRDQPARPETPYAGEPLDSKVSTVPT